ncbi:MAG: SdrD B-like domain-containing protein [Chitinophagales bacterium]
MPACTETANCVGGTVFEDYNANGINDAETGVASIEVTIYDCDNNTINTALTDENGDWQICDLNDNEQYRVEYILPPSIDSWANPTHVGVDNASDVQFVTAPNCGSFAISNPADYCNDTPDLTVVCYLQPIDTTATDWTSEAAIVRIPYESGTTDNTSTGLATIEDADYMNVVATNGEVGSVFGLSFDTQKEIVYTAAFMKRHVPFGPGGVGAIYKVENNTVSTFVDLNTLVTGTPAGTNEHSPSGVNYQLDNVWDAIGKSSFGDLVLTDDGSTLYTVTLDDSDRKLYQINVPADGSNPTAADVQSFDLPSPTDCPNHPSTGAGELNYNIRPGALHIYKGMLYIGLTCTAESSQDVADLKGYVYPFDMSLQTFGTQLLNVPFNYDRTDILDGAAAGDFFPWTPTQPTTTSSPALNGTTENASFPMPWLMDINFSDDGCMVLGITDRFGHLSSGANNPPEQLNGNAGGDILKACNLAGTWTLESNGNDGVNPPSGGANNNAGPGGGEFFYHEACDLTGSYHTEISNGGFSILRGKNELVLGVYDPAPVSSGNLPSGTNVFDSGGLIYLDTENGSRNRSFMLFNRNSYPTFGFDKASATGGITINCPSSPIEIGNYVWCDSLQNGIQDACERGIDGIDIQLYDANGLLIGTTTSSNGGKYYFNQNNIDTTGVATDGSPNSGSYTGLNYSADYFVVFGNAQFAAGEFTIGTDTYGISSVANVSGNARDNVDSDIDATALTNNLGGSIPNDLPYIAFASDAQGGGNHQFDVGLVCTCNITPTATPQACQDNGTANDASDDIFDVLVNASAFNGGTTGQFTVSDGTTILGTFDYDTGGTITGLVADGSTITLIFADIDDDTCNATVDVSQNSCSVAEPCLETKCLNINVTKN